jgi:hypothetical protein
MYGMINKEKAINHADEYNKPVEEYATRKQLFTSSDTTSPSVLHQKHATCS